LPPLSSTSVALAMHFFTASSAWRPPLHTTQFTPIILHIYIYICVIKKIINHDRLRVNTV
jgi:hypothetical protein